MHTYILTAMARCNAISLRCVKLRAYGSVGCFIILVVVIGTLQYVVIQQPTHTINGYSTSLDRCRIQLEIGTPGENITTEVLDARDWKSVHIPLELCGSDENDPNLIKHIRDAWILSPHKGPRVLTDPQARALFSIWTVPGSE